METRVNRSTEIVHCLLSHTLIPSTTTQTHPPRITPVSTIPSCVLLAFFLALLQPWHSRPQHIWHCTSLGRQGIYPVTAPHCAGVNHPHSLIFPAHALPQSSTPPIPALPNTRAACHCLTEHLGDVSLTLSLNNTAYLPTYTYLYAGVE